MDINDICELVNLPKSTIVNREIPKYILNDHIEDLKYRSILEKNIFKVNIISDLKENNTGMKSYSSDEELFVEIIYLFVEISKYCELSEVFKFISNIIPYPIVIIFEFEDDFIIYMGDYQRIKDDFLKLKESFHSNTIDEIGLRMMFEKLPMPKNVNMKSYYQEIKSFINHRL